MPNIGQHIRKARKLAGLSQEELADRIKVNRSYLSLVENGKSSPTFEFLEKLAGGLKISVEALVLGEETSDSTSPSASGTPAYEGLADLLEDGEQLLLMNPTEEEVKILLSIRVDPHYRPSKKLFVEALLDYRKTRLMK
jgi:transcriptional regulator with XRE-family HTH domain